METFGIIKL